MLSHPFYDEPHQRGGIIFRYVFRGVELFQIDVPFAAKLARRQFTRATPALKLRQLHRVIPEAHFVETFKSNVVHVIRPTSSRYAVSCARNVSRAARNANWSC